MTARPDSIEFVGIQMWLDNRRDLHNDKGYSDFVEYIDAGLSDARIGQLFGGRHYKTVTKWRRQLMAERDQAKTPKETHNERRR